MQFFERFAPILAGNALDKLALSEDEQAMFGRRFGEIEDLGGGAVSAISNRRRDGTMMEPGEPVMMLIRGNEGWHTDSSYMPVSAKASMLSAHQVPGTGKAMRLKNHVDPVIPRLPCGAQGSAYLGGVVTVVVDHVHTASTSF